MLRVRLGFERRFNIEFYGADSNVCHSAYVTWSHVELWVGTRVLVVLRSVTLLTSRDVTWRSGSAHVCLWSCGLSLCLRHVISRGARVCRPRAPREITWRKQSDRPQDYKHTCADPEVHVRSRDVSRVTDHRTTSTRVPTQRSTWDHVT